MIIGAIEAGGTKFICGVVGNEDGEILARISFPTETREETMQQAVAYFKDTGALAIGIGSFGPVNMGRLVDHSGLCLAIHDQSAMTRTGDPLFGRIRLFSRPNGQRFR